MHGSIRVLGLRGLASKGLDRRMNTGLGSGVEMMVTFVASAVARMMLM